jgi:hypothetical protein
MDDAVRARDAAREVIADIDPDRLRDVLSRRLDEAPMTPAVLTLRVAAALASDDVDGDGLAQQAAGVQLIYEGLRLTRELAHDEPWATVDREPDADIDGIDADIDGIDADLDILAADVFVSRGFYLLARTDAADRAVDVVRAFGRDQTLRRRPDADRTALDRNLESDVFALAAVTGAAAVGRTAAAALVDYAADLAADGTMPPEPVATLPTDLNERVVALDGGDHLPPSAADS